MQAESMIMYRKAHHDLQILNCMNFIDSASDYPRHLRTAPAASASANSDKRFAREQGLVMIRP